MCRCDELSPNGRVCLRSHCSANAFAYHFPAPMYALLHVGLVLALFSCCGCLFDEPYWYCQGPEVACLFCCPQLVPFAGFAVLFAWLGGLLEVIIAFSVFACCGAVICRNGLFYKAEQPEPTEVQAAAHREGSSIASAQRKMQKAGSRLRKSIPCS